MVEVKVGDRVRLRDATVRIVADGVVVLIDGGSMADVRNDSISEVLPRPFKVGDRVRYKGDYTEALWTIVGVHEKAVWVHDGKTYRCYSLFDLSRP